MGNPSGDLAEGGTSVGGKGASGILRSLKQVKKLFRKSMGRERMIRLRLLRTSLSPRTILADRRADAFLISYPKCGRTWLRMMLSRSLALHLGVDDVDYMASSLLDGKTDGIPYIRVSHDDNPHWKTPARLQRSKRRFRGKKVILLVRDPRDVVVSMYFERSRRERVYSGSIHDFLHDAKGSLKTIVEYYNIWADQRSAPGGFCVVRYEDLHADAPAQLRRLVDFLEIPGVDDAHLVQAADFASFKNMRAMESQDKLGSGRLRPRDAGDRESYKTRRGKVGGYTDYLDRDDVAWLEETIARDLDPSFGYADPPRARAAR